MGVSFCLRVPQCCWHLFSGVSFFGLFMFSRRLQRKVVAAIPMPRVGQRNYSFLGYFRETKKRTNDFGGVPILPGTSIVA